MFPIIGAAVIGAVLMGRTKPKTRVVKKLVLGPQTGNTYMVEDFEEAGFVVVRSGDGTVAVLMRAYGKVEDEPLGASPRPMGFRWSRGRGHPQMLRAMAKDFGCLERKGGEKKEAEP